MKSESKYTSEMVDFLRSNLDKYSWVELTNLFNQQFRCREGVHAIRYFCFRNKNTLGSQVRKRQLYTPLTVEMKDFLCANFKDISYEELTRLFNKEFNTTTSTKSITYHCLKNGVRKIDRLTEEMVDYLRTNSKNISYKELTKSFNKKFNTGKEEHFIKYHCLKIGIKRIKGLPEIMVDFLRTNFEEISHEELATRFNREFELNWNARNIAYYCYQYGLRKSNPGKTHSRTLPVGAEKLVTGVDGRVFIKVDQKKWKAKHRLIWEQHNGPIPKEHCVIFADGNIENCNIENLMLITKREFLYLSHDPLHSWSHSVRQFGGKNKMEPFEIYAAFLSSPFRGSGPLRQGMPLYTSSGV